MELDEDKKAMLQNILVSGTLVAASLACTRFDSLRMRLDGGKSIVDIWCLCRLQSKAEDGLQEARESAGDPQTAKVKLCYIIF